MENSLIASTDRVGWARPTASTAEVGGAHPTLLLSTETLLPIARPAQNAWRHGMYARRIVVPAEDRESFEQLREALIDEWRPRSVTAWMLVDHLAKLQWRLMRAGEAEADRLQRLQTQPGVAPSAGVLASAEAALAWDAGRAGSSLQRIQLFQMRLERSVHRVIGQLITLRKYRGKRGNPGRNRAREKPAEPVAGPSVDEKRAK